MDPEGNLQMAQSPPSSPEQVSKGRAALKKARVSNYRSEKRPYFTESALEDGVDYDEEDLEELSDDDQPDVLKYLEQWDIPVEDKVTMLSDAARALRAKLKFKGKFQSTKK